MKIALIGYGKMGQAIEKIALQKGHEITLRISSDNLQYLTKENLQAADVAIEFTGAESAYENIKTCIDACVPIICGSTGWLNNWDSAAQYCNEKNGTLLYASNFSIGVNLFFEVNTYLAKLMNNHSEYDVSITETHHTQKKDAPSGTAITLAEQILQQITQKKSWINSIANQPTQLPIISERIDPAPGTHTIHYTSPIDTIEITHTAHNRIGFANGAILAAEFIVGKKGIFTMKEVLGL